MTDATEKTPSKKPLYTRPKFISTIIVAIIFLILMFQNWQSVSINIFFITDRQVPAALLYIAFALIGFVVGWLLCKSKANAKSKKP
jgi:uncharacterized integral membrane protein